MDLPLIVDEIAPLSPGSLARAQAARQTVQPVSDRPEVLVAPEGGVEFGGDLPRAEDAVDLQADCVIGLDRSPDVVGAGHGQEKMCLWSGGGMSVSVRLYVLSGSPTN